MSYYYTDVEQLTTDDYEEAGIQAAIEHSDTWFACDVLLANKKPTDAGTVFTNYKGILFEVWLERTWRKAQQNNKTK